MVARTGLEMGSASQKGRWMHVLYRQRGQRGELFINAQRVQTNTQMPVLSTTFTAVPAYNWIGRPPFSGDSYLRQTQVADFRLYDAAVSDEKVAALAQEAQLLEQEYNYGTPGDFTALEAKVAECQTFITSATEGYAPNAVAELQDEVNICQKELQARRASQALIDEYAAVAPVAAPVAAAPVTAPAAAPAAPAAAGVTVSGGESVVAPMPGNILKVNVSVGQTVKEGELLCVLEAMKMENEIMAPAAGTVKKIYVTEGKAVQQGEALIDLE